MHVNKDGTLVSTVEVFVTPGGKGHTARRKIYINGNDISGDVLAALVGINQDGSTTLTLELVASAVKATVDGDKVQLTENTTRGLRALGWATPRDTLASMLTGAVAADAALKTRLAAMATSPDGRVDVAELDGLFEASMNDAIGEAKRRLGL